MATRVLVLGAGFGGLELTSALSEALGDEVDVTLIDGNDAFVFGFSKLDVMFGYKTPDSVRLHYRDIAKPGVRFLQETITAIDNPTTDPSAAEPIASALKVPSTMMVATPVMLAFQTMTSRVTGVR